MSGKSRSLIISYLSILLVLALTGASFAQPADVKGHWAEQQISAWVEGGLIKGYQDGSFKPDQSITRTEFVVLVNKVYGYTASAPATFSDVRSTDWYYGEVAKAVAAGYIAGYTDGTFKPDGAIARREAAFIIARILKLENASETALSGFADAEGIPQWSRDSVGAVVARGYMKGYPDNTFRAVQSITRAEAVVLLDGSLGIKTKAATYDKAGTYGPAAGTATIEGDAAISAPGIILQNTVITGNLLLAEGIGDGDVTLKNVSVKGSTTVKGGGADSITLEDCTLPSIIISKEGVRVVASGNTTVNAVTLESGAALVEVTVTGPGFEAVTISQVVPADALIVLSGSFTSVEVNGSNINIDVPQGSQVGTLILNAPATVTGSGTITTAEVNTNGSTIAQTPSKVIPAPNISVKVGNQTVTTSADGVTTITPTTSTGGSGGGGGGSPSVFAGGLGTIQSPYQIATAEQLDRVRKYLDKHFILTADIDLSGYKNWEPIGTLQPLSDAPEDAETPDPEVAFSGTFDGDGHTISNLNISQSAIMGTGLFGCTVGEAENPCSIYDLTMKNVDVTGFYLVGGVVGGQGPGCTLENVTLTGKNMVRGNRGVGGITGGSFGDIKNCHVKADIADIEVLGDDGGHAGVLVGGFEEGSLINCTATGTVKATGANCFGLGGLAGGIFEGIEVRDSHAEVSINVSGENNIMIGGLLGYAGTCDEENPTVITNCTATANITTAPSASRIGGLVGGSFYHELYAEERPVPSSYAISFCSTSGSITGGSEAIGSIAGYAYNSTVENCSSTMTINGDSNPPQVGREETGVSPFAGGSGTVEDPYQIDTPEQLDQVRNYLDKHFILTADIDLAEYENWEPIGAFQPLSDAPEDAETPDPEAAFTGTFDGNDKTISNVNVNQPSNLAAGLFGCIVGTQENSSSIYDLTVENVDVTGFYLVGGVVGLQVGTVENIRLIGHNTVRGSGQCVGGITGVSFGDIINCRAEADIVLLSDNGAAAGVLVGSMEGGSAIDCWVTAGTVRADGNDCWGLGGLSGGIFKGVAATNCHAANVSITASGANNLMVGGLLGFTGAYNDDPPTQVTGCSADDVIIEVSNSTSRVGGLVGGGFYLEEHAATYLTPFRYAISDCSTSGSITGGSEAIGSIAGYAFESTVENCTSTMTWDGGALEQVGLIESSLMESELLDTQLVEPDNQETGDVESGNEDSDQKEAGNEESDNGGSGNEESGNAEPDNGKADQEESGSVGFGNVDDLAA